MCYRAERAARRRGLACRPSLCALGEEDSSLWNIWTSPATPIVQALGVVQPGHDVDDKGDGTLSRGCLSPAREAVEVGHRRAGRAKSSSSMTMDSSAHYTIEQYATTNGGRLSFDDGPTPSDAMISTFSGQGRKGAFMRSRRGQKNVGIMKRVVREA